MEDYEKYIKNVHIFKKKPKATDKEIILGAVLGDVAGSAHEFSFGSTYPMYEIKDITIDTESTKHNITDDTVLTMATLNSVLNGVSFEDSYKEFGKKYTASYGAKFSAWLYSEKGYTYDSFGNGAAMRISPCILGKTLEETARLAYESALPTHRHPEGIKGAVTVATAIWIAKHGTKWDVLRYIKKWYSKKNNPDGVHMGQSFKSMNKNRMNLSTCMNSIPYAFKALEETHSISELFRKLCKEGRDSDTECAIIGPVAVALYGYPTDEEFSTKYLNKFGFTKEFEDLLSKVE